MSFRRRFILYARFLKHPAGTGKLGGGEHKGAGTCSYAVDFNYRGHREHGEAGGICRKAGHTFWFWSASLQKTHFPSVSFVSSVVQVHRCGSEFVDDLHGGLEGAVAH